MTVEEKRQAIKKHCDDTPMCQFCVLHDVGSMVCCHNSELPDSEIDEYYEILFGKADRSIEEKNEVVQVYCEKVENCNECKIGDLCRSIKGAFLIHNDELSEAYSIVTNEGNPNDPVNKPAHYTDGKIEVIDYIEDKKLGFCLGNAIKYISRAGKKDPTKEVEDLKKRNGISRDVLRR